MVLSVILVLFLFIVNFNLIISYHVILYFIFLTYLLVYLFSKKNKSTIFIWVVFFIVLFFWGFYINIFLINFDNSFVTFFALI